MLNKKANISPDHACGRQVEAVSFLLLFGAKRLPAVSSAKGLGLAKSGTTVQMEKEMVLP